MFDFMDMDFGAETSLEPSNGPYIPEAGDCMRCGMCVSGCPTFQLFQSEEETPRRRIRSIAKLLQDQSITAEEQQHLDNCLQCRACETVCPSKMSYGQLFDQAQTRIAPTLSWQARFGLKLIERKSLRQAVMPLLTLYLQSGLRKPLRHSGLLEKVGLAEAEALLARPAQQPLADYSPVTAERRGSVALFSGCLAENFDRESLDAAIHLLNAIGYDVLIPPQQSCCGAIHQHNGQSANALIENNLQVFNALEVDAVIHAATGCGAMLSEYAGDDTQAIERFHDRLYDINEFLLQHWPEELQLAPLAEQIAVHEPCSQRHVLKNQQAVSALLEKIPGLSVSALPDNHLCCGAGGSYMLSHPENAERLRQLKLTNIQQCQAEQVVSSNFGCALFLNDGNGKIKHPLTLLAAQLPT